MWAVVVVLPAVQDEFNIDRSEASIPYTTTMIGFAIGNLIFGRLIDRFGIVLPMIAASIMLGAGFALGALSVDIWTFALIQGFFIGSVSAIIFPASSSSCPWQVSLSCIV